MATYGRHLYKPGKPKLPMPSVTDKIKQRGFGVTKKDPYQDVIDAFIKRTKAR